MDFHPVAVYVHADRQIPCACIWWDYELGVGDHACMYYHDICMGRYIRVYACNPEISHSLRKMGCKKEKDLCKMCAGFFIVVR